MDKKYKLIKKILKNQEIILKENKDLFLNNNLISLSEVEKSFEEIDIKYRKREKISEQVKNLTYNYRIN